MKKSIFNIYVPITSQEQADRLKQVCLDNNLPIWEHELAFVFFKNDKNFFSSSYNNKEFGVWGEIIEYKTQSTEQEFMELLKQWKDG